MKIQEAVDKIMLTYGEYGVDRETVESNIISGMLNYALPVDVCYNGLRMTLGQAYRVDEQFTVEEVMQMSGLSRQEVVEQMQNKQDVSTTYVFPNGISSL